VRRNPSRRALRHVPIKYSRNARLLENIGTSLAKLITLMKATALAGEEERRRGGGFIPCGGERRGGRETFARPRVNSRARIRSSSHPVLPPPPAPPFPITAEARVSEECGGCWMLRIGADPLVGRALFAESARPLCHEGGKGGGEGGTRAVSLAKYAEPHALISP